MQFTSFNLNLFLLKHIPIAWLAGIRIKAIDESRILITLRHKWLNQNPFRSVYFGVLLMAGELSTGIPLFKIIREENLNMSMLVVENKSFFYKKATGRIRFEFKDFDLIREKVLLAAETGESVRFTLVTEPLNESGDVIGRFEYMWSIKRR